MALAPVTPCTSADLVAGRGLVHLERLAARPARFGELARPLPDLVRERARASTASGPTRPRPSTSPAPAGRWPWPPAPRRASRSATRRPIAEAVADPVRPGTALLHLPHQGAGPGPAPRPRRPRAARPRRRHLRRRLPHRGAHLGPGATPTCCSPTPRCCTAALLPHHGRWATFLHAARATSWSTSCTSCGASSAPTSPTCCAACGGSAPTTASDPTFIFCVGHHRRARPAGLARCAASPVAEVTDDGSPAASGWSRCGTRRARRPTHRRPATTATRGAARRPTRSTTARPSIVAAPGRASGHRDDRLLPQPAGHRGRRRRRPPPPAPRPAPTRVRPYRGGYLAAERREIEARAVRRAAAGRGGHHRPRARRRHRRPRRLRARRLPRHHRLDVAAGRTGRAGGPAVPRRAGGRRRPARPVAHGQPAEVFTRPPEPAVINPANPYVLDPHLACAAFERAAHPRRRALVAATCSTTACAARARRPAQGPPPPTARGASRGGVGGRGLPAHGVGLRSGLGRRGPHRRRRRHAGRHRRRRPGLRAGPPRRRLPAPGPVATGSPTLDLDDRRGRRRARRRRRVHPGPHRDRRPHRSRSSAPRPSAALDLRLGSVEVSSQVTGYQRRDVGHRRGARHARTLDLPPTHLVTRAFWYTVDAAPCWPRPASSPADGPGTLHAVEHAAIGMLPAVHDLRPVGRRRRVHACSRPTPACPTIVDLRRLPGGAGIAELGYEAADRHLARHPRGPARPAAATTAARRACSRPSAATATSPSTRPAPSASSRRSWPERLIGHLGPAWWRRSAHSAGRPVTPIEAQPTEGDVGRRRGSGRCTVELVRPARSDPDSSTLSRSAVQAGPPACGRSRAAAVVGIDRRGPRGLAGGVDDQHLVAHDQADLTTARSRTASRRQHRGPARPWPAALPPPGSRIWSRMLSSTPSSSVRSCRSRWPRPRRAGRWRPRPSSTRRVLGGGLTRLTVGSGSRGGGDRATWATTNGFRNTGHLRGGRELRGEGRAATQRGGAPR